MTQQRTADSRTRDTDPAALREVFGDNLRRLCASYPSVSELCRELGINRTQFNRYMSGESFPRPDVLHRICAFFGTDARILLEPVDSLAPKPNDLLNHPFLSEFFGKPTVDVSTGVFPSGFYRFARKSFVDASRFVLGLVMIKRGDGYTFLRGFEPRQGVREQGLSTDPHTREYRGIVMRQEEGIMAVVTHRASLSCSFNFLTPETSFQSNLWGRLRLPHGTRKGLGQPRHPDGLRAPGQFLRPHPAGRPRNRGRAHRQGAALLPPPSAPRRGFPLGASPLNLSP